MCAFLAESYEVSGLVEQMDESSLVICRISFAVWLNSGRTGTSYWLGASDIYEEGTFRWIDGTPIDASKAVWKNGEFVFRMIAGNRYIVSHFEFGWKI